MEDYIDKAEKSAFKYDNLDPTFIKDLSEKHQIDAPGLYPRLMRAVGNQGTEGLPLYPDMHCSWMTSFYTLIRLMS